MIRHLITAIQRRRLYRRCGTCHGQWRACCDCEGTGWVPPPTSTLAAQGIYLEGVNRG
jgi:hypothetical protein